MKTRDAINAAQLDNLAELEQISGVTARTLRNWRDRYPERFKIIIIGCAVQKKHRELLYNQALDGAAIGKIIETINNLD